MQVPLQKASSFLFVELLFFYKEFNNLKNGLNNLRKVNY